MFVNEKIWFRDNDSCYDNECRKKKVARKIEEELDIPIEYR